MPRESCFKCSLNYGAIFSNIFWNFLKKIPYRLCSEIESLYESNIIVSGYIFSDGRRIKRNNLGDDINLPILEALSSRPVKIMDEYFWRRRTHLLCIGSILEEYCNAYSIVWGCGAIEGKKNLKQKPQRVCAVRGPLTRKYLLQQGVDCPEIYGDPALLTPLIYSSKPGKKYELGFIPHYADCDLPQVEELRRCHPEIHIIKMKGYESWTDVIEQITSCKAILASSLHGLILADAYNIPNVRVRLSDKILGGDFKFFDYFQSVNRPCSSPIDGVEGIDLSIVRKELLLYRPILFSPRSLLNSFPYTYQADFKQ